MKKIFLITFIGAFCHIAAQKVQVKTLLKDKISIRALQIWNGKVWYSGTDSKFGYVNLKDTSDHKQIKLSPEKLQFRTLAQNKHAFYLINIESPGYFFKIDKKTLKPQIVFKDTLKTAFYDALHFVHNDLAYAFSDPDKDLNMKLAAYHGKGKNTWHVIDHDGKLKMNKGEAAFAASNTNIASLGKYLWIATGGETSRIFRLNFSQGNWEIFNTPFIQGTSSQGIYSIDFYDENFGIAVGGDYTKQAENISNIATTHNSGETWQIQASGKNGGYKTCVKIRPGSKGKEIIAVGDQNIEFSRDFGKTWTKISEEKGLFVCEWGDRNTLVFAGKDRIIKMELKF
ncbi:WD40/YVTN/BNR-like repeat-containing protein [Chryseobacterium sp.]|uniref:WD40/YVTN/BNR-like repeat-containing protein n=1 Tax=Chryseobacterium sp. TaxID=1871047 RepID=UPI0011C9DE9B|nr:glycosyl hydrolase [Chryseobacterium sp.]TXF79193.1 glycosyl hydrolase [Chryseobacterium sp.]